MNILELSGGLVSEVGGRAMQYWALYSVFELDWPLEDPVTVGTWVLTPECGAALVHRASFDDAEQLHGTSLLAAAWPADDETLPSELGFVDLAWSTRTGEPLGSAAHLVDRDGGWTEELPDALATEVESFVADASLEHLELAEVMSVADATARRCGTR